MSSYAFQKEIINTAVLQVTGERAREERITPTMYGSKFYDHGVDPRMLVHLTDTGVEGLTLRIERFPRKAPTQFVEAALISGLEDISARNLALLFLDLYEVEE